MWPILLTGDAKRKTGVHEEKRNQLGAIHLGGRQGTLTDSEKSKADMLGGAEGQVGGQPFISRMEPRQDMVSTWPTELCQVFRSQKPNKNLP